jgi:hypothetical protein
MKSELETATTRSSFIHKYWCFVCCHLSVVTTTNNNIKHISFQFNSIINVKKNQTRMELLHLHASDFPTRHHSLSKPTTISSTAHHRLLSLFFLNRPTRVTGLRWSSPKACAVEVPGGGKMVIELVGAFNDLTDRMKVLSTSSSGLLFKSLKLSIPVLQSSPLTPDGRSPLSKALSIAMLLADLQVSYSLLIFTHSSYFHSFSAIIYNLEIFVFCCKKFYTATNRTSYETQVINEFSWDELFRRTRV